MTSKNMSVSLRVLLQGSATKEFAQQLKTLRGETLAFANVATKANSEVLKLAATFKLATAEGKVLASVLGQLSGQSTLLGGRSRTLASDINVVNASLQHGARDAERMRRELERLRGTGSPRPLPPSGGAGGSSSVASGSNGLVTGAAVGFLPVVMQSKKITDYDYELAHAANVAYAEKGSAARIAGKSILNEKVLAAARHGGTTREQALETYNAIVAQGVDGFKGEDAANTLPMFLRAATATGASPTEIANIALKSVQSLGLSKNEAPKVLEMALKSGQEGGFELRDMAKWLPEQMANMRGAGLSGLDGLSSVLALNQMSLITAGSTDTAGNNVVNLLGKINSDDTARDLRKFGIDLSGRIANNKAKGKDGLDTFFEITKEIADRDPRVKKLQQQIDDSKTPEEKRKLMLEQADILQGSALGKIIQDRQARAALLGAVYNQDKYQQLKSVQNTARNDSGIETNYGTVSVASKAEFGALATEVNNAFYNALNPTVDKLGDFAQSTADVMAKYPTMSKYVVATGAALTTLAAVTALASWATGKNLLAMAMADKGLIGFATRLGAMTLGMAAAGAAGYAVGTALRDVTGWAMDKFGLGDLATTIDNSFGEGIALILARFGIKEAEDVVNMSRDTKYQEKIDQANQTEALINDMVERAGYQPVNLNATFQVDGSTLATIVESYQVKDFRRN